MNYEPSDAKDLFVQASQWNDAQQRNEFLERNCQGNADLRARVEQLLQSHDQAGSFLGHAAEADLTATIQSNGSDPMVHGETRLDIADLPKDWIEPCDTPGRLGKFGSYEIMEVIGRGGMGIVFKAYDTKLQRVVAIKSLTPMLAGNPTATKRFLREARAAAAISHEHVVTIFAVEESSVPPFLVMQCIIGKSLQQKIDQTGPLETAEILRIGTQIAEGLSAAHKQGLIHRDIKPANILLENGVERVTITDFGLARAADDVTMTQTGYVAGTPEYMSPEQAKGESLDMRSDLFSLGSVLYTLCAGRPAFRAESTVAVLRRVCDDEPRPLAEVNPSIPDVVVRIIEKLMAKRPEDRFQSATEVAEKLSETLAWIQQPSGRTPPFIASPRVAPKPAVSRLVRYPVFLGIALLAAWAVLVPTFRLLVLGQVEVRFDQHDSEGYVELFRDGELIATQFGSGQLQVPAGQYEFQVRKYPGLELDQFLIEHRNGWNRARRVSLKSPPKNYQLTRGDQIAIWLTYRAEVTPPSTSSESIEEDQRAHLAVAPFDQAAAERYQAHWASKLAVPVELTDPLGIEFRLIPAGSFMMGNSQQEINAQVRELELQGTGEFELFTARTSGPRHRVRLTRPYYLSSREITVGQFKAFVEATGYRSTVESVDSPRFTWESLATGPEAEERPVLGVSWEDAKAFCRWLSKRHQIAYDLPTEAQWEFACRAGNEGRWSFGDDNFELSAYAFAEPPPAAHPQPGARKLPNSFGLFDMHGNVDEWCLDWHMGDFYSRSPIDDPAPDEEVTDPASGRVIRGGAWNGPQWLTQSASRTYDFPGQPVHPHGFRIAIGGDLKAADQP